MSVVEPIRVKLTSSPGSSNYVCYKSEESKNLRVDVTSVAEETSDVESSSYRTTVDDNGDEENEVDLAQDDRGPSGSERANDNFDEDDGHVTDEDDSSDNEGGQNGRQSPKNKRKNFKPRNISCSFDDNCTSTSDNEVDNDGEEEMFRSPSRTTVTTADVPLDLSDGGGPATSYDCPSSQTSIVQDFKTNVAHSALDSADEMRPLVIDERHDDDDDENMAMDLSTGMKSPSSCATNNAKIDDSPKQTTFQRVHNSNALFNHNVAGRGDGTMTSSADASDIKNYAEDTMKELLGLYGLNNELVESITQNVPLQNFSSGKILENLGNSGGHLLSRSSPSSLSSVNHLTTSALSRMTNNLVANGFKSEQQDELQIDQENSTISAEQDLRTKVVDGMSKLTGLPPNNIIGNPRVILPQNMATTLLTLAALGNGSTNKQLTITKQTEPLEPLKMDTVKRPSVTPPSGQSASNLPTQKKTSSSAPSLDLNASSQKIASSDYSRYVRRFSNAAECGSTYCKDLNYREHFHCLDCNSRVFIKKEEMIRHFKWHKKRDESLQYGFMRYSPMDDCSDKYPNCSHMRKQTHYHCVMDGCDKCYISTSDVQMHANYHRKDSAIIKEGFQRFRATEDCGTQSCSFYGQRTTHFHCRRNTCNYTFKNKADMEKHKTYHIKDEQLNRDGFKKFMKHELCAFENCRFSRVCNHIHCIRPGCTYVLHSSGQLYSHKRKHERRDNEMAYRKFKLQQSMMKAMNENSNNSVSSEQSSVGEHNSFSPIVKSSNNQLQSTVNTSDNSGNTTPVKQLSQGSNLPGSSDTSPCGMPSSNSLLSAETLPQSFAKFATLLTGVDIANSSSISPKIGKHVNGSGYDDTENLQTAIDLSGNEPIIRSKFDDSWKNYFKRYTANDPCKPNCEYLYKDHYHCMAENCDMMFKSKDGVREHTRNHEQQDQVTEAFYATCTPGDNEACPSDCPYFDKQRHYHCSWEGCQDILLPSDKPFRRLDHYKMHEYSQKFSITKESFNFTMSSNADVMFKRKRGRPPKNRVVEVCDYPSSSSPSNTPQAVFTSFKLPKMNTTNAGNTVGIPSSISASEEQSDVSTMNTSSSIFSPLAQLPNLPLMAPTSSAAHAMLPFAFLSGTVPQVKPEIQEGFYVYKDGQACSDPLCIFLGKLHYHCTQPRCFYVTDRSDILILHSKDFHDSIDISDGFVFFDRNVDCRLQSCHNNKINRHFHCARPGCNYSFVRYSTMSVHDQRHIEFGDTLPQIALPKSESPSQNTVEQDDLVVSGGDKSKIDKTIKSTGTFYPLSAFPLNGPSTSTGKEARECHSGSSSPASSSSSHEVDLSESQSQHPGLHPSVKDYQGIETHVQYDVSQSCGRPFCKLKKREHFHCNICNQAFSCLDRLKPHVLKHAGAKSPILVHHPNGGKENPKKPSNGDVAKEDGLQANDDQPHNFPYRLPDLNSSGMAAITTSASQMLTSQGMPLMHPAQSLMAQGLNFYLYGCPPVNMEMFLRSSAAAAAGLHLPTNAGVSLPTGSVPQTQVGDQNKIELGKRPLSPNSKIEEENKRIKQSLRILKDEPVPDGYIRYRFNEDCQYQHCGYREHQTHFHCVRKDCGYSFCDKTRFVQHTARHERLDTLMGGDFQQYRANVHCGRSECAYANTMGTMANKASHFHCLKCEFVCTDTNKVVAHRRQHSKLDSIMAAGFEKFTPSQNCAMDNCSHNHRQTHYHCTTCQYSVLGLSQMSAHRYRHMD